MEKFNHKLYDDAAFSYRPKSVYHAYARSLWEVLHPKSILDLGCANGYALEWWQKQGIKVSGVEPATAAFKYMPRSVKRSIKQLDLRRPLKLIPADVVNITEVAEHIDSKYERAMLDNVISAVKNFLVIAWSNEYYADRPDDHVNPRPAWYVKLRLKKRGLYLEPELSAALKKKLMGPEFKDWLHWSKNILVFSRTPQTKRVLILHHEYQDYYQNKNVGYFMQRAEKMGFAPRFITEANNWRFLAKRWHRVWLYPFEKHLLTKLLLLKLFGNQTIIKMDSQVLPVWRAWLVRLLADKILVESQAIAQPFGQSSKLVHFSGALSQKNISLIKSLKIKREKIILYAGRQTYPKGFDRLKKIIPAGWKLKMAANLAPQKYYPEILRASVVVLPTRGEGWPNVFQDAFFCRRLFLTTTGAKCGEAIKDKTFYCDNSVAALKKSLKKVTDNIDGYYKKFDSLYDQKYFQIADRVFSDLLK